MLATYRCTLPVPLPLVADFGLVEIAAKSPGVLIVASVMTFLSVGAVAFYWSRAVVSTRNEAARLRAIVDLSAQGRSPEEIERLLGPSRATDDATREN